MDKRLFDRLAQSMGQMNEIDAGVRPPSREFHIDAERVQEIRARTGMSQQKFASALLVDVGTLRNWEQGRRSPTGPAKALLRAIANDAPNVMRALRPAPDAGGSARRAAGAPKVSGGRVESKRVAASKAGRVSEKRATYGKKGSKRAAIR
jgi:putative transcriptional regulator